MSERQWVPAENQPRKKLSITRICELYANAANITIQLFTQKLFEAFEYIRPTTLISFIEGGIPLER